MKFTLSHSTVADLSTSGLHKNTIEAMGVRPVGSLEVEACKLNSANLHEDSAYVIPYFTLQGGPTDFYRIKILDVDLLSRKQKYLCVVEVRQIHLQFSLLTYLERL